MAAKRQAIATSEREIGEIPPALLEGFAETPTEGFEIRTARQTYMLLPKESSAETWIEAISEVMFDDGDDGGEQQYGDFLTGYNDVTQEHEAENNPEFTGAIGPTEA